MLYLPNLLCVFRVVAAITILILGRNSFVPYVFSAAFISDLLDGYFYRKYTASSNKKTSWLSKLPIGPDPLADFIFSACGLAYIARLIWISPALLVVGYGGLCLIFNLCINHFRKIKDHQAFKFYATFFTYFCYLIMILSVWVVWIANSHYWAAGFVATMIIFYFIYFTIGDKDRRIRHL